MVLISLNDEKWKIYTNNNVLGLFTPITKISKPGVKSRQKQQKTAIEIDHKKPDLSNVVSKINTGKTYSVTNAHGPFGSENTVVSDSRTTLT